MTIQVTGILKDSSGEPSPNTPIQLLTVKGSDGVLPTAFYDTITDIDGNYDFTVNIGIHYLLVRYQNDYEKVGQITVNADTPSPLNLDSLLSFDEPLTPEQILQVQQLVAQAVEAADRAEAAAESVEGIEQAVEEDRQEVATNAAEVRQNAQAVESARSEVEQNAQAVAANTQTVSDKTQIVVDAQNDVTNKAQQVSDNADQVAQDKSDVADSALLSQMWAAGSNPSNGTPSDTNNAKYWSDRASQFATGALIYGGLFTPTAGTPYPPEFDTDIMYLVNFDDPETTFTYTNGDLNGTTVKNGNAIIYNTPENKYEASSFVFTGVATVNGKSPDGANNVDITASDVGAYSEGEVDTALEGKADKDETYTKDEVVSFLESVNDHRIGSIEKFPPLYIPPVDEYVRMQGEILVRSDYQKLFDKMNITDNMVTDTEWLAIQSASPNGAVAVYSSGDGSTTFRTPTTGDGVFGRDKGAITDPVLLNVGKQDQIVNIEGQFFFHNSGDPSIINADSMTGALHAGFINEGVYKNTSSLPSLTLQSVGSTAQVLFDASRVVNTGDQVQPNNMYEAWYIYTGKTSIT